jgi:BirA family biotin operon repressor/biotin-[acetyl-CoA-carboxylase] ligase
LLPAWSIRWLEACTSTSDALKAEARAGAPSRRVLATTDQTAGRGRRGNAWITAPGEGLALSALWHARVTAEALGWVGLVTGLAVAEALEAVGVERVQLKWPNDLLREGAKLGGILVETVAHAAPPGQIALVVGIGINLGGGARLSAQLGRAVTDLDACGVGQISPDRLTTAVLAALDRWLPTLEADSSDRLREVWSARDALLGRRVSVEEGDRRVDGIACGLATDGGLQVRTVDGWQVVHSGNVSIGALAP